MTRAQFGYRPALDGLRAVAVVAVFLYHLGYRWLPGGFLGVDLFFVLSGYLITSLLLNEHERTGRIDLGAFWFRRAKRLLPALLLLLVCVALWVAAISSPVDLALRRRDLLWTLFYGANWHFIAADQDYFAQFSSASPLRHAWSLAIEEQFYLVWPILVAGAALRARNPRRAIQVIGGVGIVASAAAAAWLYDPGAPSRAYYDTGARLHQPLMGAWLAAVSGDPAYRPVRSIELALGGLGVAAIVGALLLLDDRNPAYYLGLSLGVAVCTAATIRGLEASPGGFAARVLSWKPVRWVGQISYGLYLWHWPVILAVTAAPAVLTILPGSTGLNLTRIALTFATASASFYLVERPIRHGRVPWIKDSTPRSVAVGALATLIVGGTVVWATRVTPQAEAAAVSPTMLTGCPGLDEPCLRYQGPRGAPVVALIGDSIARSLDPAFEVLAREHGWTYVLAAGNGCRITDLLTSYGGIARPMDRACYETTPRRLQRLLDVWDPATIVSIDRWVIIDAFGPDGSVVRGGTAAHLALSEQALVRAADRLTSKGAKLAFLELPPVVPRDCEAPERRTQPSCSPSIHEDPTHAPYNELYHRIAEARQSVFTISIAKDLCPTGRCTWDLDGMTLRWDGLHFTIPASQWLAPAILRELVALGVVPE